ncbi:MAG: Holliday junction branch migration protein RuvA [Methylococcaceae bacterium]|nr:Holliday junction branch migration protein RuvA [Methylococcaceae bacterium]MCI0668477.1 Holliday junction branch migration protein RuvA [Methylococcaceae bacterium]MCI0732650.1 Holliday junction branch migration protein RuvA [Methylococcaceae bacterium]
MIGFLRGLLVAKSAPSLLLDVNGVGYEVEAPMATFYKLPEIGREVHLYTHLVVREDAQLLFGFSNQDERALFRSLIKVNGVGARLALTLLSGLSVDEFHRCVQNHDTAALVRLPGIGKKTAERLIIEMRDRLPASDVSGASVTPGFVAGEPMPVQEAVSALIALGYKNQDAHRMVNKVAAQGKSSEEIIRAALQAAR